MSRGGEIRKHKARYIKISQSEGQKEKKTQIFKTYGTPTISPIYVMRERGGEAKREKEYLSKYWLKNPQI